MRLHRGRTTTLIISPSRSPTAAVSMLVLETNGIPQSHCGLDSQLLRDHEGELRVDDQISEPPVSGEGMLYLAQTYSPCPPFPLPRSMKTQPRPSSPANPQTRDPDMDHANKNDQASQNKPDTEMTTSDFKQCLESLKNISKSAVKTFTLLGVSLSAISHALPVQRGYETVRSHFFHTVVSLTEFFPPSSQASECLHDPKRMG